MIWIGNAEKNFYKRVPKEEKEVRDLGSSRSQGQGWRGLAQVNSKPHPLWGLGQIPSSRAALGLSWKHDGGLLATSLDPSRGPLEAGCGHALRENAEAHTSHHVPAPTLPQSRWTQSE